jgi:hypothetical protein
MIFCGLSSGFDIMRTINFMLLKQVGKQYEIETCSYGKIISELLSRDNSFFFNNLCAKLRFFGSQPGGSKNIKHLLLVLRSLKDYAPDELNTIIKDLFQITSQNLDNAIINQDQS